MTAFLTDPIYQDAGPAREWREARIWPKGPFCSHCGSYSVTAPRGKKHRPGLFQSMIAASNSLLRQRHGAQQNPAQQIGPGDLPDFR